MIPLLRRLWFLASFAATDLFSQRRALRITLVNLATVLALVALTIIIYGRTLGGEKARMDELRGNPLALCFWVGGGPVGEPINEQALGKMTECIRGRLADPDRLRACCGFYTVDRDWFDAAQPDRSRYLSGRTLAPGDPLLESCTMLPGGEGFATDDAEGVLVARAMLEMLHFTEAAPARLRMRIKTSIVEVPVVGVLKDPLPDGYGWLMTEAYEERLRSADPDPSAREIRSGPIPEAWAPWRRLDQVPENRRRVLAEWLSRNGVRWVGREPYRGGHLWRLRSEDNPLRKSDWVHILQGVGRALEVEDQAFTMPDLVDPSTAAVEPRKGYDRAGIYLTALDDLNPAAEAVRSLDYELGDTVINQLDAINRSLWATLAVQTFILVAVGLLAAWNLWVIQDLRAQQKVTEIGMLKAMGMGGWLLFAVYMTEAVFVWLPGAALGLAFGLLLGPLVAGLGLTPGAPETAEAGTPHAAPFYCPVIWLLVILGVSAFISLGTTWWATRKHRRAPPIESLSSG